MKQVDVMVTALRRPDVFELMCKSFLCGRINGLPPVRMILNIDPLGHGSSERMIEIAEQYSNELVVRKSKDANFASAINWCVAQVKGQYALHVEDDWILLDSISWSDWAAQLNESGASQISLIYKKRRSLSTCYSFRPNLFKVSDVRAALPVPLNQNPEKFVAKHIDNALASADILQQGRVLDVGRKWAKGNGLRKANGDKWFENRSIGLIGKLDWFLSFYYYQFVARRGSNS